MPGINGFEEGKMDAVVAPEANPVLAVADKKTDEGTKDVAAQLKEFVL